MSHNGQSLPGRASFRPEIEDSPEPKPECKDFEVFWAAYPRKQAKGNARRAWKKIRPGKALLAKILIAIEEQRGTEQWTRNRGQFIPHPATWLNGERWEDEVDVQPAPGEYKQDGRF